MITKKRKGAATRREAARRQFVEAMAKQNDTAAALDRTGKPRMRNGRPVFYPAPQTKA